MKTRLFLAALCSSLGMAASADAMGLCTIRIIRPVSDEMGNRWKVGETSSTTVPEIDPRTGAVSFCAHGGSCIPEFVATGGRQLRAAVLQNCWLDRRKQDYIFNPERIPASKIAQEKLETTMAWLGLSFAGAASAASEIADDPWSAHSTQVLQALKQARADVAVLDR